MLTLTELLRNIENSKKSSIKAKILGNFYQGILDNATDFNRSEGDITINFEGREETAMAFDLLPEIFQYDYDFKRYVVEIDSSYKEDYEMIITFDLNKQLKELDNSLKTSDNEEEETTLSEPQYASDDIPF